eukprot:TRINITY_DN11618_c0_g4_i1.p1 TRINITY_DN11618_c0_g4~~TRINITY_DN11618_c0_g4_i1.p1  ORF type:complete len:541 (+),score=225.71 TRINITY_DN11618_c0_g4_i1:60-1625(+)
MAARVITQAELKQHDKPGNMWMSIDGDVYDLTKFEKLHPGGPSVLRPYAGKDATDAFFGLHRVEVLRKYRRLRIGRLEGAPSTKPHVDRDPWALSMVPYAEPSWFQGFRSAYWKDSHKRLRLAMGEWVEKTLGADAERYERDGKYPTIDMYKAMGKNGILAARLGPGAWMKELDNYGIKMVGDVANEFDYFHEWIVHQELFKLGTPAFVGGLGDGFVIGMPPVMHFAKGELQQRLKREILTGEKRIALAISEPHAGSDVANLVTTAKKSPCGRYFIVNGAKKWITNGAFADYFCTAVRTGAKGMFGISMLLIPRTEGVKTTQIPVSYSSCAGTSYVSFEDVKVPVENLLGRLNQGFRIVMFNFNHERWGIVVFQLSGMRAILKECFLWAHQRKAFGKSLIQQPVIRAKLAAMISKTEAVQNWLENITYQMNQMPFEEMNQKLAGQIALLKYHCTRMAWDVADDAAQMFGGRGITRSGMGRGVEAYLRTIKLGAILGGSEEIMADLGVRQAMRNFNKDSAKL